ncbi:beta-lactamase family protein [Hypoxylon sp. EC38]|nr:beta-lactamase family protein [Hypoxylon sp. EC38]
MEFFRSESFSSQVRYLMAQHHAPGISVAIVQDDEVASAGYGHACLEPSKPCTADTLFDIASSSKSMTAAAVGLLVEDNKNYPEVQYQATMSSLLPEDFVMPTAEYTNGVTVDDVLSHRTGMGRHDDSCRGPRSEHPDDARSVTRNLRNLPLAHPLRASYRYCNMMYTVATHLVEVKTQKTFTEFLEERFFGPLGMDSTSLQPSNARAKGFGDRLARGHHWDKENSAYHDFDGPDSPESQGAGSIITSVNDFIKWVKALLRREGPISEKVYQGLIRLRSFPNPGMRRLRRFQSPDFYAAGLEIFWYRGYMVVGHDGSIPGFGSRFFFLPELGFGAALMGNSRGANAVVDALSRQLVNAVLKVPEIERLLNNNNNDDKNKNKKAPKSAKSNLAVRPKNKSPDQVKSTPKDEGKGEIQGQESKVQGEREQTPSTDIPQGKPKKPHKADKKLRPQTTPLSAYVGKYWNPGYHTFTVQVKDEKLFIDAINRSGFTLTFEHVSNQTKYTAHLWDEFEGSQETIRAEFVFDNGRAVKMGLDLEMGMKQLIWFELEKDSS